MSTFRENIVKARAALVFLIGLTAAFATVIALERFDPKSTAGVSAVKIVPSKDIDRSMVREQRKLTAEERQWAEIAWRYFVNNYQEETGLVNSVDGYPASTLWDTSSYLLGMISAYRLDIISKTEFTDRTRKLLETLATLELYDNQLPNKSYNTISSKMSTYDNEESERGIGWSAIDIGRLMVPLNILVWKHPEFTQEVGDIVNRWDLAALAVKGEMMGADLNDEGQTIYLQEGRLGYEEYAAKALSLIGIDVSRALDYEEHLALENIYDVAVGTDLRTPEKFGALNYVVSEPYVLDGIEFGWDRKSRELSERVYAVQEKRYERTGIVTAASEDNIDQAPYFVYNTIFSAGKSWNTVTEAGEELPELKTVSTKAAIGLYALYDTEYSDILIETIKNNFDSEDGWYSGIYESDNTPNKAITANTNGIILEALHFIENGPLVTLHGDKSEVVAEVQEVD